MSIADNPTLLAEYIQGLGGTIVDERHFEIRLAEARKIIPEINRLGLRAEKVSERQGHDPNGRVCGYATIELRPPSPPTEYSDMRNLMWATQRD
jgi:hypothetical protein